MVFLRKEIKYNSVSDDGAVLCTVCVRLGDMKVFILSGNGRGNTAPPDKLIIILPLSL